MTLLASARTALLWYFILAGLFAHVGLFIALWFAYHHYDFSPRELAAVAIEQAEKRIPFVAALLRPSPRHLDHAFDGRLRGDHPRILLPELSTWNGAGQPAVLRERDQRFRESGIDAPSPCASSLPGRTTCWLSRGDADTAAALLEAVRGFEPRHPDRQGAYGNGWELAFAYDFLRRHPGFEDADRIEAETKLTAALGATLTALDGRSASLWHGRSTLAAIAWLIAVVLDPDNADHAALQRRAQGHFLDAMAAWRLTEGWPEGYNYWIQSRGFLLALAASAYLNGLEEARHAHQIRETLRRAAYWHIHGTRPDQRAEGFGDEGSRVDLKDETRRIIDLIAQAVQDPLLAAYSRHLQSLYGEESYYRDYRWGFRLFNDPALATPASATGLKVFENVLPRAELFGAGALNLGYIRSDWSDDATFIAFRAGHNLTHHGHYDAGHFTLFKGAPLAVNSSVYGDFTGPNRLHYSIRSIAKNTLLILRPGEKVRPNRLFTENVSDGGQRITLPTGSGIRSVGHWRDNLESGLHLRGGEVLHFERENADYAYVKADLTHAYNTAEHDEGGRGGKVTRVMRELVYLYDEDRLIVHDQVETVNPAHVKKWLLHTVHRPEVDDLRVLTGADDNGILESPAATARVVNAPGHLLVQRLLPEDAVIRLVGGPDYQYYVEADGDEGELDGVNMRAGAVHRAWFDTALWRIEIQPSGQRRDDRFLVALSPGYEEPRTDHMRLVDAPDNLTATLGSTAILGFIGSASSGTAGFIVGGNARQFHLFGLPPRAKVTLNDGRGSEQCQASVSGACSFHITDGPDRAIRLNWR